MKYELNLKAEMNFGTTTQPLSKGLEKRVQEIQDVFEKICTAYLIEPKWERRIKKNEENGQDETVLSLFLYREAKQRRTVHYLQNICEASLALFQTSGGYDFSIYFVP